MSYILDALRRAQAERGRGAVPGLHTPAVTSPSTPDTPAHSGGHRGAWLIAGLAAVAAIVLAWLQFAPRTAPHTPVVVASAPTPTPAPVVAPEPVKAPEPVVQASAPVAASAPVVLDVTPPPPPPPAPPKVAAAPAPAPVAPAKPTAASNSQQPAAVAPVAAAAPAAPIYNVANLPPTVREQLPSLQLAGITYSSNPQYRMVIVNGQVLHEGDSAGPGLVLERIETARTIWAFKGYRYALP